VEAPSVHYEAMATSVVHVSERLCIAECHRVAINIWRGAPRHEDWRTSSRHLAQLHRRFSDGIAALVLFPVTEIGLKNTEVDRAEMEAVTRRFIACGRACALVIEGDGFIAATVRSVLVGLTLVTRPPFPTRIFSNTGTAIHWIAPLALGEDDAGSDFTTQLSETLATARAVGRVATSNALAT
jgi:hypothetical protein